jgi:hypothetical protein
MDNMNLCAPQENRWYNTRCGDFIAIVRVKSLSNGVKYWGCSFYSANTYRYANSRRVYDDGSSSVGAELDLVELLPADFAPRIWVFKKDEKLPEAHHYPLYPDSSVPPADRIKELEKAVQKILVAVNCYLSDPENVKVASMHVIQNYCNTILEG